MINNRELLKKHSCSRKLDYCGAKIMGIGESLIVWEISNTIRKSLQNIT